MSRPIRVYVQYNINHITLHHRTVLAHKNQIAFSVCLPRESNCHHSNNIFYFIPANAQWKYNCQRLVLQISLNNTHYFIKWVNINLWLNGEVIIQEKFNDEMLLNYPIILEIQAYHDYVLASFDSRLNRTQTQTVQISRDKWSKN